MSVIGMLSNCAIPWWRKELRITSHDRALVRSQASSWHCPLTGCYENLTESAPVSDDNCFTL